MDRLLIVLKSGNRKTGPIRRTRSVFTPNCSLKGDRP